MQLGSLLWASLTTQGEGIHLQGRQVCQPLRSKFFSFRVDLFSLSENGSTLKEKNLLSLGVICFPIGVDPFSPSERGSTLK